MRDRGRIVLGLLVFLALATFPIWFNLVSGEESRPPEIVKPVVEETGDCVRDGALMRTAHMQLLMDWRDEVVRDNDRIFVTADQRRYYKSLSSTCMDCHDNKDEFCDRCHDYLSVAPYCWDCHVEPKGGQ
jgi:hypothetical protein